MTPQQFKSKVDSILSTLSPMDQVYITIVNDVPYIGVMYDNGEVKCFEIDG